MGEFEARNSWSSRHSQRLGPSGGLELSRDEAISKPDNFCQMNLLPRPGLQEKEKNCNEGPGAWMEL